MKEKEHRVPSYELEEDWTIKDLVTNIRFWWNYLVSKWLFISISFAIGASLGVVYALIQEPKFSAVTTFVLEEESPGAGMLGQLGGLASLAGIDAGGAGGLFQGENIIQLYKSRSMIVKTLLSEVTINGRRQLLVDKYIEFNKFREKWEDDTLLRNISFRLPENENYNRRQDSLLGFFTNAINDKNLYVNKPDKKLSIIKVEVYSESEEFSKAFNDQLVKNVNDFYIQTKTKKAIENLEILQRQTDSVRNVLSGAINSTAIVNDATPNLNPTRQILRAPAQRSQFNAEANKEILKQLVQNLELAKLSLRQETPLIQVIDAPVFPLLKDAVGKTKSLLIGAILMGFISVFYFVVKKMLRDVIDE